MDSNNTNRTYFNITDNVFVLISYIVGILSLLLGNNGIFIITFIFVFYFKNKNENTNYISVNLNNIFLILLIQFVITLIDLVIIRFLMIVLSFIFSSKLLIVIFGIRSVLMIICRIITVGLLVYSLFKAINNQSIDILKFNRKK